MKLATTLATALVLFAGAAWAQNEAESDPGQVEYDAIVLVQPMTPFRVSIVGLDHKCPSADKEQWRFSGADVKFKVCFTDKDTKP